MMGKRRAAVTQRGGGLAVAPRHTTRQFVQ